MLSSSIKFSILTYKKLPQAGKEVANAPLSENGSRAVHLCAERGLPVTKSNSNSSIGNSDPLITTYHLQEFLTMLVRMGADVDIQNEAGETALRSCLTGRQEVLLLVRKNSVRADHRC